MGLQEIDASKWQWMMVKADERGAELRRICLFSINGAFICVGEDDEDEFLRHSKLPALEHLFSWKFGRYTEPLSVTTDRENTQLDVMWWSGVRHVCKNIIWSAEVIHPVSWIDTRDNLSERLFNELHLVNGHAELKHKKWLTYNELVIK